MFTMKKLALISAAGLAALSISCSDSDDPSPGGEIKDLAIGNVTDIGAGYITGTIAPNEGATIIGITVKTENAIVNGDGTGDARYTITPPALAALSVMYVPDCKSAGAINIKATVTVKFSEGDDAEESTTKSYTCAGSADTDLEKSSAVTVGGTGSAGSFVDLDPKTPKAYTSGQFADNIGIIDIIYGAGFGGEDAIYSTFSAAGLGDDGDIELKSSSINFTEELLALDDFSSIHSLTPADQAIVKSATKYSQVADIAVDAYDSEVDYISATNGTAFFVVTNEGAERFVIINSKSTTISVDIINISGF